METKPEQPAKVAVPKAEAKPAVVETPKADSAAEKEMLRRLND